MQDEFTDFRAVMARWPSARAFARDVAGASSQELGRIWHRRNRVPRALWPAVLEAAARRQVGGLSTELLARLYKAGRGQGR